MASARVPLKRLMPLWQTLNFMVASDICLLYFSIDPGSKNLSYSKEITTQEHSKCVTTVKFRAQHFFRIRLA